MKKPTKKEIIEAMMKMKGYTKEELEKETEREMLNRLSCDELFDLVDYFK